MKKIVFGVILIAGISFFISSCSPVITPYQAANHHYKCGKHQIR